MSQDGSGYLWRPFFFFFFRNGTYFSVVSRRFFFFKEKLAGIFVHQGIHIVRCQPADINNYMGSLDNLGFSFVPQFG